MSEIEQYCKPTLDALSQAIDSPEQSNSLTNFLNQQLSLIIKNLSKGHYSQSQRKQYDGDLDWFARNEVLVEKWLASPSVSDKNKNALRIALLKAKTQNQEAAQPQPEDLELAIRSHAAHAVHGTQPIFYQGKFWNQVDSTLDWVHHPETQFVSLGSSLGRERMYIDLGSTIIKDLKVRAEKESEGKSTKEILSNVNEIINELTDQEGMTRQQVEAGLDHNLSQYLNRKPKNAKGMIDCTLDELVEEKLLVCRHKAAMAACVLSSLVEKGILEPGTVRQYRSNLVDEKDSIGAHTWAVYRNNRTKELFVCDPRWGNAIQVIPPDFPGLHYGKKTLRDMVKRLDALDGVMTPVKQNTIEYNPSAVKCQKFLSSLLSHGNDAVELAGDPKNPNVRITYNTEAVNDTIMLTNALKKALDEIQIPYTVEMEGIAPVIVVNSKPLSMIMYGGGNGFKNIYEKELRNLQRIERGEEPLKGIEYKANSPAIRLVMEDINKRYQKMTIDAMLIGDNLAYYLELYAEKIEELDKRPDLNDFEKTKQMKNILNDMMKESKSDASHAVIFAKDTLEKLQEKEKSECIQCQTMLSSLIDKGDKAVIVHPGSQTTPGMQVRIEYNFSPYNDHLTGDFNAKHFNAIKSTLDQLGIDYAEANHGASPFIVLSLENIALLNNPETAKRFHEIYQEQLVPIVKAPFAKEQVPQMLTLPAKAPIPATKIEPELLAQLGASPLVKFKMPTAKNELPPNPQLGVSPLAKASPAADVQPSPLPQPGKAPVMKASPAADVQPRPLPQPGKAPVVKASPAADVQPRPLPQPGKAPVMKASPAADVQPRPLPQPGKAPLSKVSSDANVSPMKIEINPLIKEEKIPKSALNNENKASKIEAQPPQNLSPRNLFLPAKKIQDLQHKIADQVRILNDLKIEPAIKKDPPKSPRHH